MEFGTDRDIVEDLVNDTLCEVYVADCSDEFSLLSSIDFGDFEYLFHHF